MAIRPEAKGAIIEKAGQLYNSRLKDRISKSDVRLQAESNGPRSSHGNRIKKEAGRLLR